MRTHARGLLAASLTGLAAAAFTLVGPSNVWAGNAAVYSSIPGQLPGNVTSLVFEASTAIEVGDHVALGAGPRTLASVRVVLSSWACQSGHWYSRRCATTPGATFAHPITLSLYAVDTSGPTPAQGALLGRKTQSVDIPYRPAADPTSCPAAPTQWYSATDGACHRGYAFPVTFDFSAEPITLPDEVIWTVAFNTTHFGPTPLGEATACYNTADPNCPYDSLGVGVETFTGAPFAGADADPYGIFSSYASEEAYCDAAPPAGVLRLDNAHPASPDSFSCLDWDTAWLAGKPLGEIVTTGDDARAPDRLACYDVRTHRPRFTSSAVAVAGAFGTMTAILDAPRLLCLPADINGSGIVDPARRLTCYGLRDRPDAGGTVGVEDEVGVQTLDLRHRGMLCVPSAEPGSPGSAPADHVLLTAVSGSTRPARVVSLATPYGTATVRLQHTTWVGEPAAGSGNTPGDPESRLTCDRVTGGGVPGPGVEVVDRFGALTLTLGRVETACVPARTAPSRPSR